MKKKLLAIYARVSSNGQNPDMQLRDLRQYAKQRKFKVFKEYVDVGISGTQDKRPQLDQLMEEARKRKFDSVLVWRFDRFARSTKHLVDALHEFKDLGVDFLSYQENIDTSSAMGEAIFTIISAIATLERDILAERVQGGLRRARAEGKVLGRPQVEIGPRKLKKAARMRREGRSYQDIAAALSVPKTTLYRALRNEKTA